MGTEHPDPPLAMALLKEGPVQAMASHRPLRLVRDMVLLAVDLVVEVVVMEAVEEDLAMVPLK